ncbi:MAG: DUF4397 domain-containing protein [Bacteroidota bacterium]
MKNQLKNLIFIAIALPLAVSVTSCKDDEEDPAPAPAVDKASLMVTHASPDAPGVDLLVDNNKVNSSPLTFPNSTGYLSVNAGTRNVKVNVAGTTTTVINADLPLTKNNSYSVFAVNTVANIEALFVEDDLTSPASGKAHVRFIHLSPDAPAVDIALDGAAVVFPDVTFKEYTDFTPLDAGSYDLEVRVAGTSTVALDLDPISLQAGKIYTVFAKGTLTGTGSQALSAQIIVNK